MNSKEHTCDFPDFEGNNFMFEDEDVSPRERFHGTAHSMDSSIDSDGCIAQRPSDDSSTSDMYRVPCTSLQLPTKAVCQVPGCATPHLDDLKDYNLRYKICTHHSNLPMVIIDNQEQRFCQKCGKFHPLAEYDGPKKSCRASLEAHNKRRRARTEQKRRNSESQATAAQGVAQEYAMLLQKSDSLRITGRHSDGGAVPAQPALPVLDTHPARPAITPLGLPVNISVDDLVLPSPNESKRPKIIHRSNSQEEATMRLRMSDPGSLHFQEGSSPVAGADARSISSLLKTYVKGLAAGQALKQVLRRQQRLERMLRQRRESNEHHLQGGFCSPIATTSGSPMSPFDQYSSPSVHGSPSVPPPLTEQPWQMRSAPSLLESILESPVPREDPGPAPRPLAATAPSLTVPSLVSPPVPMDLEFRTQDLPLESPKSIMPVSAPAPRTSGSREGRSASVAEELLRNWGAPAEEPAAQETEAKAISDLSELPSPYSLCRGVESAPWRTPSPPSPQVICSP